MGADGEKRDESANPGNRHIVIFNLLFLNILKSTLLLLLEVSKTLGLLQSLHKSVDIS